MAASPAGGDGLSRVAEIDGVVEDGESVGAGGGVSGGGLSVVALEGRAVGDGAGLSEALPFGALSRDLERAPGGAQCDAAVAGPDKGPGRGAVPASAAPGGAVGPRADLEGGIDRESVGVVDAVVAAAGALQPDHMPAVFDFDVLSGEGEADRGRAVEIGANRAGHDPVAVSNAAGEGPASAEAELAELSVGIGARLPFGVGSAGHAGIAVAEEGVEGGPVGQARAGDGADVGLNHGDPAAGEVGRGQRFEHFDLSRRVNVVPAQLRDAGHGEDAVIAERLNSLGRESAQPRRCVGAIGEHRSGRFGSFEPVGAFALSYCGVAAHGSLSGESGRWSTARKADWERG